MKNEDLDTSNIEIEEPKNKKIKFEETVLGEKYHPSCDFQFPSKKIGEKGRSCQYSWFKKWPWLHYDLNKDAVFCHPCNKAYNLKSILEKQGILEKTFISGKGFSYWKNATERFSKHQVSECHLDAMSKFSELNTLKV